MAKKTKADDGGDALLAIPLAYGNVNIGDETARLGVTVGRGVLTVTQADKYLCGKRLIGRILVRAGGAQAEQGSLAGMEEADSTLDGVFDVKSFSVSTKNISFGLTFSIASVDIETLAHFAKREGVLTITRITDIPDDESEEGAE